MSQWLRSNTARTMFAWASWLVVCVGLFMALMGSPWFQQLEMKSWGEPSLRVLGGALGIVGAPASLFIWFGMVIFCLREDRSSVGVRTLWCILFFATAFFGAAAYFFAVYRKQVRG